MTPSDHDPVDARLDSLRQATSSLVAPAGVASRIMLEVRMQAAAAHAWRRTVRTTLVAALGVSSVAAALCATVAVWYHARSLQAMVAASALNDEEP